MGVDVSTISFLLLWFLDWRLRLLHIGYTEEKQLYYIWFKERIRIICVSLSRKVKSRQGEGGISKGTGFFIWSVGKKKVKLTSQKRRVNEVLPSSCYHFKGSVNNIKESKKLSGVWTEVTYGPTGTNKDISSKNISVSSITPFHDFLIIPLDSRCRGVSALFFSRYPEKKSPKLFRCFLTVFNIRIMSRTSLLFIFSVLDSLTVKQGRIHGIRCVLARTEGSFGQKGHFCMVSTRVWPTDG